MSLSETERKLIEVQLTFAQKAVTQYNFRISDIEHDIETLEIRKEREAAYLDIAEKDVKRLNAMLAGD